jgi:hypothetical protein
LDTDYCDFDLPVGTVDAPFNTFFPDSDDELVETKDSSYPGSIAPNDINS